MKTLVFDIETNGLKPSEIYCLGIHDVENDVYTHYVLDDVYLGLMELTQADLVVGHNIRGFDLPVIKKLTEGLIDIPETRVLDTLDLSRELFGDTMPNHKLATWGEILGYPKLEWNKFHRFYDDMVPYMDRDVEINVILYHFLKKVKEENLQTA